MYGRCTLINLSHKLLKTYNFNVNTVEVITHHFKFTTAMPKDADNGLLAEKTEWLKQLEARTRRREKERETEHRRLKNVVNDV